MAATREEETIRLMFGTCACTPAIKLNSDWQMAVISRKVCVMDGIASLAALYWVDIFKPCDKHIRVLAKKVGLVIKNVPVEILWSRLEDIWRNRELARLEQLVSANNEWFAETLQWAVQKKGS